MLIGGASFALYLVVGPLTSLLMLAVATANGGAGLAAGQGPGELMPLGAGLGFAGLFTLLAVAAFQPALLGYERATIRSLRGQPIQARDLLWGFQRPWRATVVSLPAALLGILGLLCCTLPAGAFPVPFAFASFVVGDRDVEAGEGFAEGWRIARPHLRLLALWGCLVVLVAYAALFVPIVGALAVFPLLTTGRAVAYEALTGGSTSTPTGAT